MKQRIVLALAVVVVCAIVALIVPTAAVARPCVQCPVLEDPQCPPCYELILGTCTHCAYCKKIPGCKP